MTSKGNILFSFLTVPLPLLLLLVSIFAFGYFDYATNPTTYSPEVAGERRKKELQNVLPTFVGGVSVHVHNSHVLYRKLYKYKLSDGKTYQHWLTFLSSLDYDDCSD